MRKMFPVLVVSLFIGSVTINAQPGKKEQPPPPPKLVKEKSTPPAITNEAETTGPPVINIKGKLADEFYERNPSVSEISRQGNITTLKNKDGTTGIYDMSKKKDDKRFTGRYGNSPIPPPPPPPKVVVKN